jgi:transposase-like protein
MDTNKPNEYLLQRHIAECEHRLEVIERGIHTNEIYIIGVAEENIKILSEAAKACEKQIGKKVIRNNHDYTCPTCGANATTDTGDSFIDFALNFCEKCGQKLDWSDE